MGPSASEGPSKILDLPALHQLTHWVTMNRMQTVAETPTFSRQADKLFSEDEKRELIDYLAGNPLAGDEIRGTGGVRKVRFRAMGRGKRGGVRVIYFYAGEGVPIYALLAYSKSDQIDLSSRERRAVAALVKAIKSLREEKR